MNGAWRRSSSTPSRWPSSLTGDCAQAGRTRRRGGRVEIAVTRLTPWWNSSRLVEGSAGVSRRMEQMVQPILASVRASHAFGAQPATRLADSPGMAEVSEVGVP